MTDSQTLISADIGVAALHILISFIFFLAAMSNLGDGKVAEKERKSFVLTSGIFWLISLLACITILVLLTYIKPKVEKTPCPVQLSQPGDSDRGDIENFLNDTNEELNKLGHEPLPDFDSSLTYLVVTGFYKNHLVPHTMPTPTPTPSSDQLSGGDTKTTAPPRTIPPNIKNLLMYLKSEVAKLDHVPIGFIKDNTIYALGGRAIFEV